MKRTDSLHHAFYVQLLDQQSQTQMILNTRVYNIKTERLYVILINPLPLLLTKTRAVGRPDAGPNIGPYAWLSQTPPCLLKRM